MEENKKECAIITVLGLTTNTATYKRKDSDDIPNIRSMFHYFLQEYVEEYDIIPISTPKAKEKYINKKGDLTEESKKLEGVDEYDIKSAFKKCKEIPEEKDIDFSELFKIIDDTIFKSSYEKVIIDVSQGYRYIPMLMFVDLIVQRLQHTQKKIEIESIFATKQSDEHTYEIIDLKDYLDIANIMFVVSSFKHNFTTSNIEVSSKYSGFINSLCEVSNDLLSLNINHLTKQDGQGSANKLLKNIQKLQEELEKETQNKEHFLINPLKDLAEFVKKELINFEGKKYYQTYLELSEIFYERDYLINSIALLCESARYFIKTQLKRECSEDLTNKIESIEDNLDTYETLRFFSGLSRIATNRDTGDYRPNLRDQSQYWPKFKWVAIDKDKSDVIKNTFQNRDNQNSDTYDALQRKCMAINGTLSKVSMLSDEIDDLRNKLVHINPNNDFDEIKKQINEKIERYKEIINEDTPTN
ncbi:TM1812 family CRISPR-associated protein [Helicobacter cetorum]|uniref:TM1812 family CRISPR-associated protein n=1 Tax=Helicobacter cetorum TaxID=138563 RepID=UPI000CF067CB|nr:TM1812 family CRISPR-associated protein [Helicobacter cetorum]